MFNATKKKKAQAKEKRVMSPIDKVMRAINSKSIWERELADAQAKINMLEGEIHARVTDIAEDEKKSYDEVYRSILITMQQMAQQPQQIPNLPVKSVKVNEPKKVNKKTAPNAPKNAKPAE